MLPRSVLPLLLALVTACSGRLGPAAEAEPTPEDGAAPTSPEAEPTRQDDAAPTSPEAALRRLCGVMAEIGPDRSRPLRERIDAIEAKAGPDAELLDDLLEGADSWSQVEERIEARGVTDFRCPPMKDFVMMVMEGRDDTAPATNERLAEEIDELCALASRVVSDESITEGRLGEWMQRVAKGEPSPTVRSILESVASMGHPDPSLLQEALAEHARPGWSCPAIDELFVR